MEEYKIGNVEVKLNNDDRAAYIVGGSILAILFGMLTKCSVDEVVRGIKGSYIDKDVNYKVK